MTAFLREAPPKKIVFVLETYDYPAVRKAEDLNPDSVTLLESVAKGLDATALFAVEDPGMAGRAKNKIGITRIRKERPRLLTEISHAKPDIVICFGPTAVARVFRAAEAILAPNHLSCS